VIGIDEVGRGALAGPVTVVATALAMDAHRRAAHAPFRSLKDSKKLRAPRREFWAKELRDNAGVRFAISRVYPRGIERLNISAAANRAAQNAVAKLLKDHKLPLTTQVYLDGGLFVGSKRNQQKTVLAGRLNAKTVIKADEKFPAVAAASIIAKVSRDRFMTRLAKRHPAYGFGVHKGYGTAAHFRAIKKNGPCEAHRLTFLAKRLTLDR
jgi:ribonuclease HII